MTRQAPAGVPDAYEGQRRLRVALLTPSIGFGSSFETPVVRLLADCLASVTDLHVYPMHGEPGQADPIAAAYSLHRPATEGRFARRLAQTVRSIRREHQRDPFDLIHALWLHEPGTIAVMAGMVLRLPVVASVGGAEVVSLPEIDYGALRNARGRLMTAMVLQRATIVTAGSGYAVRMAQRVVPHRDRSRFRRAPLPVDAAAFAPPADSPRNSDGLTVLHAASLIPVKDQTTLIRAFRRVVDLAPNARLTIAGEDPFGYRAELESLRDELGLRASMQFIGHRRHHAMPALYHAADLFVLSSRHESQGMVVCEAAAAGVPTVGTAVGVIGDLAPDAASAVAPGDPAALADAILAVLTDPVRRERIAERAKQRIANEYDVDAVRNAFVRLYHDAIALYRR